MQPPTSEANGATVDRPLEPRAKLWLEVDGKIALSGWRVALPEGIEETGSLAKAAERLAAPHRTALYKLREKERLTAVLTYHVVPGKVLAADVMGMTSATTVRGQDLTIGTANGAKVDDATVTQPDIATDNGVILPK